MNGRRMRSSGPHAIGATNTRALALRGLAEACTETLAVWLRRMMATPAHADDLSALLLFADDIVWQVQLDSAFVTDATRRREAGARLHAQAVGAGIPARDHLLNLAVEVAVAGLKGSRRLPPNAGA